MLPFVIPLKDQKDLALELQKIGVDRRGIEIMALKASGFTVKVKDLATVAANILKQEMLSRGGEAAVAYGAVNNSIPKTDVLILGTLSQFKELIPKLKRHQFGLPGLAEKIEEVLRNYQKKDSIVKLKNKTLSLGRRTCIMGILNVTPDSFSDGGEYFEAERAVARGLEMAEQGADIIDVGGQSTRPGSKPISTKKELERVILVIKRLSASLPERTIISIDTQKSKVAEAALSAGASMVNDVSALRSDPKMARVIAKSRAGVCLMHMKGSPRTMQKSPRYDDLIAEILAFLEERAELALSSGISRDRILIDPGIGFGKTLEHNLAIIQKLAVFKSLGFPILVGPSRKSFIGKIFGTDPDDRLEGTASAVALSIANGADIVRVHDVAEMAKVAKMTDAVMK